MRRVAACAAVLLSLATLAGADDQEKAEKQIRMITAMSRDDTARSIISRTFSDTFKIPRAQLVQQRKTLNLNYGGLFLVQELLASGARLEDIANQLHARKAMLEIAAVSSADWRRIAADAKKMNSRINDGIYKHFLHSKPDQERDKRDLYTASADLVRADLDTTRDEILKAQQEYVFRRNLAAPINGGRADPNSAMGQAYQQARQEIEESHGASAGEGVR
jgi:cell division protein FtsL